MNIAYHLSKNFNKNSTQQYCCGGRYILTSAPRFVQLGGQRKLQTGKTAVPLPGILFRSCGSDWQYINLPPNRDACSNLLE